MKVYAVIFITAVMTIAAACGSKDTGSELMRVNAVQGTLYVVPAGNVTGGQVTYYIYENGLISYVGDVSYNFAGGTNMVNMEMQPSFSGKYKADAATIKSATYGGVNASHKDFKVMFTVTDVDQASHIAKVSAIAPRENAFGNITIDISAETIKIKSAEITGDTPIGRLTLKVSDQKAQ